MTERTIDYDRVSKVYDTVRVGDPEMVQQILNSITLSNHSLVLDIGCGTGNNTLLFAEVSDTSVVGLDLSLGMLREARKKLRGIPLTQSMADSLPFLDNSFDLAFMTEVIHHLPDTRRTIEEISRILKPKGALCVVTQSHRQIADRMTSRFFPATIKIDQARYPDIDQILRLMKSAMFESAEARECSFKPVRLGEEYLKTVSKRGYSMLHKISDDDYYRGLSKLREAYEQGEVLTYSAGYTFVWGIRR